MAGTVHLLQSADTHVKAMEFAMQPPVSRERESVPARTASILEQACPVCSGPLVESRSERRCLRCGFGLCDACDGGLREHYADDK